MVRAVALRSDPRCYEDFFYQTGSGLPVFIGGRPQRGRGLGSLFSGLGRAVVPVDVLSGKSVKSSLKDRASETGKRVFQNAVASISGQQPAKRL